ncbi:MAG: hypothetical protein PXY39_15040 [archaeon]|nr:hypothetical protein [archaeon]
MVREMVLTMNKSNSKYQDRERKQAQEAPQKEIKRPNLFVIKEILAFIDEGDGLSNFSDLAEFCHAAKNRRHLGLYLKLLLSLKWIQRNKSNITEFMSGVFYELTDRGRSFLSLFPKKDLIKKP